MKKELFRVEVGVLLPPTDKEFECYRAYDNKQFGFYDEDQSYTFDKDAAIAYAKDYVAKGVDDTYAVVSTCGVYDKCKGIEGTVWVDMGATGPYNAQDVIYSRYKIDNDHAVDGFIQNQGS